MARPGSTGPPDIEPIEDQVASLFRAHGLALIRVALLLVGDQATAEDVVQDAFLGLHRALPRLKDRDRAVGYLRVSVVNGCRSVRRARRRVLLTRVEHDPPVWSAEAAVIAEEDRRAVLAALARLPHRARAVIAFRYLLDLPQEEIGALLGITRGTVSSTISRALDKLGRDLREEQ
jgi:RNA polymerase sigma-70 factor (sigma-E family)